MIQSITNMLTQSKCTMRKSQVNLEVALAQRKRMLCYQHIEKTSTHLICSLMLWNTTIKFVATKIHNICTYVYRPQLGIAVRKMDDYHW